MLFIPSADNLCKKQKNKNKNIYMAMAESTEAGKESLSHFRLINVNIQE